jgi:1-acyl-sn-glycerol-3-phosphate acyltransferase
VASNHPNGFLEPLIMACFFPKPLHFLVRGDVFENPILRPVLTATNQLPIFRFKDGFSKLRENSHTMDESIRVLLENKNLLIFAEGGTESIKKLRPLQKGISRIAFQAMEKNPDLDLEILPVGINFTYPSHFDVEVMLKIGKPLHVKNYMAIYNEDQKAGHEALLSDLYAAMKINVIHLENQSRIHFFEKLVVISRIPYLINHLPVHIINQSRVDTEILLAQNTDKLSDNNFSDAKEQINALEKDMKSKNLVIKDLLKYPADIVRGIVLLVGLIPAFTGLIIHVLPIIGAYLFTYKVVKQKEFRASILMVTGLILFLLLYILYVILLIVFGLPFYLIVIAVISAFWLRFYYGYLSDTLFIAKKSMLNYRKQAAEILSNLNN